MESVEPSVKPNIIFTEKNRFQFSYSTFSSYLAIGTYELTDTVLTLRTDDGKNVYVFDVKDNTFIFDEEKSSAIPKYNYSQGDPSLSPVPDGAVFR